MPWAWRHFTVLTVKKRSSSPVFSSRRLWPFSDSASALSQLPWCLRRWWVFPKSDQGFCTSTSLCPRYPGRFDTEVIAATKSLKVRERCSFQGWDKFGIKCTWYSNLWNAVWDMKSARKWLVWFLCRRGKDVLSLGVCNGWKEFGIFGRRLLCNVSLGHENRRWTGEDFSLLSTSFRGQRCLWRKFPCPHHALHVYKLGPNATVPSEIVPWDFFGDVHNTSKILNKGTVALDQKNCVATVPAWPVTRLQATPAFASGNMCFGGPLSFEPIRHSMLPPPYSLNIMSWKKNHRDSADYNEIISNNQPLFGGMLNLLYTLCFSTEATTKNTRNSQVIPMSKTVSSQTSHPIMGENLVNPASAVQGFCFCP